MKLSFSVKMVFSYIKNCLLFQNKTAIIKTTNKCHLWCDRQLISVTECTDGLWTGSPDLGFWCNEHKEAVRGEITCCLSHLYLSNHQVTQISIVNCRLLHFSWKEKVKAAVLHTSSHTMRCRSVGHLLHVIHCHTYILGENFYYIIIYNVMRVFIF